jgi:hypothetical protein
MHAAEMSFGISGNHPLQCAAADHLKTAARINSGDKIALLLTFRLRAESPNIGQGSLISAPPLILGADGALWLGTHPMLIKNCHEPSGSLPSKRLTDGQFRGTTLSFFVRI